MGVLDWMPRYLAACPGALPQAVRDRSALRQAASDGQPPHLSIGRPALAGPQDLWPLRIVLVEGEYIARGFLPRAGWTIIDCGANIGGFTAWAARKMRAGRLLAIEAVPTTYQALVANVGSNGTCRPPDGVAIVTVNAAVAAQEGVVGFTVAQERSSLSGRNSRTNHPTVPLTWREVMVQGMTLDGIAAANGFGDDRIDLLKIDVEGMEVDAMRGAAGTLKRSERVEFEYHSAAAIQTCAAMLAQAGFTERLRRSRMQDTGMSFWARTG